MEILFIISFLLILYTYLLYPLTLVFFDKVWKVSPREFEEGYRPKVSLLVSLYNEEKIIGDKLENCLKLDYPKEKLEIVMASDGCEDATNEIVGSYQDKGITLYAYQERRGKVNVLNTTIDKLKNEIIVFSDANTMFLPNAIDKLVRHFSDPKVGCVCGTLRFINPEGSRMGDLEGVYWKLETLMKKIEGKHGSLLGANGGIFALRKELFYKCPPDTIVEDFVVPMKIKSMGYEVLYEPEAIAIEEAAQNIQQEKQRRIRIGAGDFQALFRLLPMLNPLLGFSAWAFWSHKVIRWITPFLMITCFVLNILLLDKEIYQLLFLGQLLFYSFALGGYGIAKKNKHSKIFSLCYYFVSMNYALFLGFFRFLKGTQKVTWLRTER